MVKGKKDPNGKTVKAEKHLKTLLYYSVELLIDVLLIYVVIHGFSMAFQFSYNVFHDSALNAKSKEYVVVTIEPDSSSREIAKVLKESGVIRDENVMWAKIVIGEYGSHIKAGRYGLSPSMTYKEILGVLTGDAETDEEPAVVPQTSTEDIPAGASVVPNYDSGDGTMPDEGAGESLPNEGADPGNEGGE